MNSLSEYKFGGRPVTSINLFLMLGEMEGVYQHLKYMGFEKDMDAINEMKQKYYKMYFNAKKKKEEPIKVTNSKKFELFPWSHFYGD